MPDLRDAIPDLADELLSALFPVLDALAVVGRRMYPPDLLRLVLLLTEPDRRLRLAVRRIDEIAVPEPLRQSCNFALQACDGLLAAEGTDNPMREAYRAMRQYSRAVEALTALAEAVPAVGRYLLEPRFRDDPAVLQRLAQAANPDAGAFHFANETAERGGYSVYVPAWYDATRPLPVVFALHGGSGHGRLFLWNWVPEARARGVIVVAPTAVGSTWSLMEPEIDSENLLAVLTQVRNRWNVDPHRMMLSGMSDGGTFTLLSGLDEQSPFTHLGPVAAAFHPMLLAMAEPRRLTGLPIYLVHGALDWMFPVDVGRTAHRTLAAAGAAIAYREISDLSHAYPRDEQGPMLDWFLGPAMPLKRAGSAAEPADKP